MSDIFVEIPFEDDPARKAAIAFNYIATHIEGWEPSVSNLETIFIEGIAEGAAENGQLAGELMAEAFRKFGEQFYGVHPVIAQGASALTTWTMINDDGYTVPQGTGVLLDDSAGSSHLFVTLEDVVVPNGDTDVADVNIIASETGAFLNGISGTAVLNDSLGFVETITIQGETDNGVDDEEDADYLNRLARTIQSRAGRPVLPIDVEDLVRTIPGIERALALDNYNATTNTSGQEKTISVAVADDQGEVVSGGLKTQAEDLIAANREVNFIIIVFDPTYTTVSGSYSVVKIKDADPVEVKDACDTALAAYLSPVQWGWNVGSGATSPAWGEALSVYRNELISLLDGVAGVSRVTSVTITGADGSGNLALTGKAPMPRFGTWTGTVT